MPTSSGALAIPLHLLPTPRDRDGGPVSNAPTAPSGPATPAADRRAAAAAFAHEVLRASLTLPGPRELASWTVRELDRVIIHERAVFADANDRAAHEAAAAARASHGRHLVG